MFVNQSSPLIDFFDKDSSIDLTKAGAESSAICFYSSIN